MQVSDFDYDLPQSFIAQQPAEPRDSSKLMVIDRHNKRISHAVFHQIGDWLERGDVLVLNDTRVIPARVVAHKAKTGGKAEILLLKSHSQTVWEALIGGRNIHLGDQLIVDQSNIVATIREIQHGSMRIIEFSEPIMPHLSELGTLPLPPYIHSQPTDQERYQTIYNRREGSAAAPTAGLHFTQDLLTTLAREKGIKLAYCTLHIGLDTFQPVKVENIQDHHMHSEFATLSAMDAQLINEAKLRGNRIIAVGTTSARTLETAAILSNGEDPANPQATSDSCPWRPVIAFERETNLFIYPSYRWRVVDGIITNFHLPKSTLLMMIASFAGYDTIMNAYEEAKNNDYRFFSFGDSSFIY
ncbi:MAG: tRNA preQ1(34) S-adenosylmethionine ribosyltransferase-isomerase QueA [Phototrophicaceae bacterium]